MIKFGSETETNSKPKIKFGIVHLVIILATVVVMTLGAVEAFLALNVADDISSFLFGPVTIVLIALAMGAFVLAASERTSTTTGTIIGITTSIGILLVATWWRPFENIDSGSLLLGILGGLSFLVAACVITYVTAVYFHKKSQPVDSIERVASNPATETVTSVPVFTR